MRKGRHAESIGVCISLFFQCDSLQTVGQMKVVVFS